MARRRLRSMLRQLRQTVAMELAALLHHSRDGGRETYYGLRAPKTASSGGRPSVLTEPEPQGEERPRTFPRRSQVAPEPRPLVHLSVGEVHDGPLVSFLLQRALLERREEEEAKKMSVHEKAAAMLERARLWAEQKEKEKKRLAVHEEAAATLERARLWAEHKEKRRKRKKRKKRKKRRLPRTSSGPSRCRARLRPRQRQAPGWFSWFSAVHAVFPSFVDRPQLLGLLVGIDHKDSSMVALVVSSSSFVLAGIAGDDAFRAVFPSLVDRPRVLGIRAGMLCRDTVLDSSGKCFVLRATFGSTLDSIFVAVFGAFWPLVPGSHLFGAGCCLWVHENADPAFSAYWLDSGYRFGVSSRSF